MGTTESTSPCLDIRYFIMGENSKKTSSADVPLSKPGIIGFSEHKNRKPSHDTHLAATIFRRSKITSFGSNGSLGMSATLLPALAVTATQNLLRKPPWL